MLLLREERDGKSSRVILFLTASDLERSTETRRTRYPPSVTRYRHWCAKQVKAFIRHLPPPRPPHRRPQLPAPSRGKPWRCGPNLSCRLG